MERERARGLSVVSRAEDSIDVFVRDWFGTLLTTRWQAGVGWSGLVPVG